jgi:ABC-type bacteriocin/lantibiotic exporter with double-glycine peptidase domain
VFLAIFAISADSVEQALTTISVFLLAGLRLAPSLIKLQGSSITLRNLQTNIDRLRSFCQIQLEMSSNSGFKHQTLQISDKNLESELNYTTFIPTLRVDNLSYRFPGQQILSLENISFEVKKGDMFGIKGETGSGKSTLADLCVGLKSPTSGLVELSGVEATIASQMWPGRVAYFSQNVSLTNGTVAQNIALGASSDEINFNRVEHLLDLLDLRKVFSARKLGALELLGENGHRLSGGQRQRIGIARALYHDPNFLLLDEPTSAQDPEMEDFLNDFLVRLRGSLTIVLISHRSKSINLCDTVIEMSRGKIV